MDAAGIAVQLVRLKFVEPVDYSFLYVEDGENTWIIDTWRHAHGPRNAAMVTVRHQVKSRFRFASASVYRLRQPARHGTPCQLPIAGSTNGKAFDSRRARGMTNDKLVKVIPPRITYFADPAL